MRSSVEQAVVPALVAGSTRRRIEDESKIGGVLKVRLRDACLGVDGRAKPGHDGLWPAHHALTRSGKYARIIRSR